MNSPYVPPVIQAVGLACVPIEDMPQGTLLARKPVAAAVVTLQLRDDGHREVVVTCASDMRTFEFPLPVLVEDALVAGAPTVITAADRDLLAVEAAARRFFVEPKLGKLASGHGLIDPLAIFGDVTDETALCHRLGIAIKRTTDQDVAQWWCRGATAAAEDAALTTALGRLIIWAHSASFDSGQPDAFFEAMSAARQTLIDLEADHPELKSILASRAFGRVASFAGDYRDYRAKRDAGDETARWLTFEEGLSYV